jgi:hypothetical protein
MRSRGDGAFAADGAAEPRRCAAPLLPLRAGAGRPAAPALEAAHQSGARAARLGLAGGRARPPDAASLRGARPVRRAFLLALRETCMHGAERRRGRPAACGGGRDRSRVDAFFAIDVETSAIADANPAAGALRHYARRPARHKRDGVHGETPPGSGRSSTP